MNFDEYYQKLITANLRQSDFDKKQFFVLGSEEYLTHVASLRGIELDNYPFIIPQEGMNKSQLFYIDRKTKRDVENKFGIFLELDWQCNTISNIVIENILKRLILIMHKMQCTNLNLNFYDLFSIGLSTKIDKNAEKEGNINVFFKNDCIFDNMNEYNKINNIFDFTCSKYSNLFKQVDSESQVELANRFGILISDTWVCTAITYIFLKNICNSIINDISDRGDYSFLNFNDVIEFHAYKNNTNIMGSMRPGMIAKLIVKSDEITEYDYGGIFY